MARSAPICCRRWATDMRKALKIKNPAASMMTTLTKAIILSIWPIMPPIIVRKSSDLRTALRADWAMMLPPMVAETPKATAITVSMSRNRFEVRLRQAKASKDCILAYLTRSTDR